MTGGSVIMFYLENERKGHLKTRNNQKKLLAGLQPGRVCYEKCFPLSSNHKMVGICRPAHLIVLSYPISFFYEKLADLLSFSV